MIFPLVVSVKGQYRDGYFTNLTKIIYLEQSFSNTKNKSQIQKINKKKMFRISTQNDQSLTLFSLQINTESRTYDNESRPRVCRRKIWGGPPPKWPRILPRNAGEVSWTGNTVSHNHFSHPSIHTHTHMHTRTHTQRREWETEEEITWCSYT